MVQKRKRNVNRKTFFKEHHMRLSEEDEHNIQRKILFFRKHCFLFGQNSI